MMTSPLAAQLRTHIDRTPGGQAALARALHVAPQSLNRTLHLADPLPKLWGRMLARLGLEVRLHPRLPGDPLAHLQAYLKVHGLTLTIQDGRGAQPLAEVLREAGLELVPALPDTPGAPRVGRPIRQKRQVAALPHDAG